MYSSFLTPKSAEMRCTPSMYLRFDKVLIRVKMFSTFLVFLSAISDLLTAVSMPRIFLSYFLIVLSKSLVAAKFTMNGIKAPEKVSEYSD